MQRHRSEQLYIEAQQHIVGGVNSPSRSYKAVGGGAPVFMKRASGAYLWDVDGNKYIDYLAAYGPIIVGHAHPHITEAIRLAAENGTLYGTPTELEIELARMLKLAIPSMDKVRLVNSGTEAVMTTIRVARAYTGRNKIIKFAGCYHGHSDLVLVAAGSGPSTLGIPDSAGVPASIASEVITVPYNDVDALRDALERWGEDVAAVMIEPIVGNFGMVMPKSGYLSALCRLTREHGALVIYDEVISAFRFHYGGAQNYPCLGNQGGVSVRGSRNYGNQITEDNQGQRAFQIDESQKDSPKGYGAQAISLHEEDFEAIRPDLTSLGKIIGGGLPIGAYGGREDIMEKVSPLGATYQAGTMAGNPISVSAGIACLQLLQQPNTYEQLDSLAQTLTQGLADAARQHNIPLTINRICGAFSTHFCNHPVTNYGEAQDTDGQRFSTFFNLMLDQGIYLAPSKYEAWFLTIAHTQADIKQTIVAAGHAFEEMSQAKSS